ncbi:hypothetical protein WME79_37080 [Sorangium sp. So ce726]|uniref:hypothetical protein n=1 Tax=Sorangium sp. So ce726 TaxID=3133319 RepID=UPI003F64762D
MMTKLVRRSLPRIPGERLRAAAALGLAAALAPGAAACSLVNPFGEVKTSPDTGGGGTGGGGPHEDDCLDGLDGDSDGDIDCADADCQPDHECVVAPAIGWKGPLYMATAAYAGRAPQPLPCPDGKLSATYYAGPSPAECTPCDCTWTGAACAAPKLLFSKSDCDSPAGLWQVMAESEDTACVDLDSPDTAPCNFKLGSDPPKVLSKGQCSASGGELTSVLPWSTEVQVCAAAAGGGCAGDKVCVHKAPPSFQEVVCVTLEGEVSCPPGWLDRDLDIYNGGEDHRTCTACSCSVDAVSCSGGSYTLNVGSGCLPPPGEGTTEEITGDTCKDTFALGVKGGFQISAKPELGTPEGLQCSEKSEAAGSVEVVGKAKVCCRELAQ